MTRIEKYGAGQAQALTGAVRAALSALAADLTQRQGIEPGDVGAAVFTGNTAMLYILTGHDPEPLSRAPYKADRLFGETVCLDIGGLEKTPIYLPRCVSAFVGADITAAVLASGMTTRKETALLVDIGTNGEIALWREGVLYCCSTAAGPAFEGVGLHCGSFAVRGAVDKVRLDKSGITVSTIGGAAARGLCGSGVIDAIAVFLKSGVIDETGAMRLEGHPFADRMTEINGAAAFRIEGDIVVTAADVRAVQLAKGALRAGIETLLHVAGVEKDEVATLYIAGGFGHHMDMESAAAIGLIPPELAPKSKALGNAAQTGAAMLLQNRNLIAPSEETARAARTVTLAANPVFMDFYMEYMMFL
jgi:uncharacterized 2Fe-2S/4Fe-4S cluster protein (DUF4445 family)